MKLDKRLKIALIVLLIILVSVISFVGIFVQDKNTMKGVLKDYIFGMDLKGSRTVGIVVDNSNKTIYYDKDGKVVEKEAEGGRKEEIPVNSEEVLNTQNYIKTREIIEKRLTEVGVADYLIRQDEKTGKMVIQIPEDSTTDLAIQYIYTVGKFTVEDEEGNVLLDNSNLKGAKVGYATDTSGTTVYLNIEFYKDCYEKLREISNTYVKSADEEGKEITKKVIIKIDDQELISTSFSEEIPNGVLSLSVGTAATSSSTLNTYLQEANNLSVLLNSGKFPVTYGVNQNRYVQSDITTENMVVTGLVTALVVIAGLAVFIVKYKKSGLMISIGYIGYVALLLLALRYANVLITTEGLFGILVSMVLNYVFNLYLLEILKKEGNDIIGSKKSYNQTVLAMILVLIPALIVGITLCLTSWLPMYSFGAIIFWGILLIFVYNTIVTRALVLLDSKNK